MRKNIALSNKTVRLSVFGYILVIISLVGFFGYYLPSEDATVWQWGLTFSTSLALLASKNRHVPRKKRTRTLVFDFMYFLLLLVFALFKMPYGINLLALTIIGAILIVPLLNESLGAWKKE